ncbi:MAG TPA: GNAT family N-acetyltransferase [Chloroflexaceae bacterium]|nr:GNAT family N-acetyltransferase [Chloroflexaceae bacterium]
MSSQTTLREATPADEPFLWEMLALAAHMADDGGASVEAAREHPFLAKYVRAWGRPGDLGVIALAPDAGRPLGAAWLRHQSGPEQSYAAVNPAYPELAIAVRPSHAGRGLGGALLGHLLALARGHYPGVVLSVRADNPARRLYERHGFVVTGEIVNRVGTRSHVMELRLAP